MAMAMVLRRVSLLSLASTDSMAGRRVMDSRVVESRRVVVGQERRSSTVAPTKADFRSPRRFAAAHRAPGGAGGAVGSVLEHTGYRALQARPARGRVCLL